MTQQLIDTELDTEELITELDISHLVIEDDTAMDNFQSEEQQRLLVEPLYSSKVLPARHNSRRRASNQMKNSPKTENKARYSGFQFSKVQATVGAQSFAPSACTVSKRELM